jgi:hypothetical protein
VNDPAWRVVIAADQRSADAQANFARLVSQISSGELQGVVLAEPAAENPDGSVAPRVNGSHKVRRGAILGAGVGFLVGLIPLVISTVAAAAAGSLIAKASQARFNKGTAPRLRFPKHE